MRPLYESAEEQSRDEKRGTLRRRGDSRSKKEDEVPIIDGGSSDWHRSDDDDVDGLGVSNRGADITFNELYESFGQTDTSLQENDPEAPPVPPRVHVKRS